MERISPTLISTHGRNGGIQLIDVSKHEEFVYSVKTDQDADRITEFMYQVPGVTFEEAVKTFNLEFSESPFHVLAPLRLLHRLISDTAATRIYRYAHSFSPSHMSDIVMLLNCRNEYFGSKPELPKDTDDPVALCERMLEMRLFGRKKDFKLDKVHWSLMFRVAKDLSKIRDSDCVQSKKELKGIKRKRDDTSISRNVRQKITYQKCKKLMKDAAKNMTNIFRRSSSLEAPVLAYDKTRANRVTYRRGLELMHVFLQDNRVLVRSESVRRSAIKLLLDFELNAGPVGKIGLTRKAENNCSNTGDTEAREGLDEVIRDVNDGNAQAAAWLFSHALSGRIIASSRDDSTTSWFRCKQDDGQVASEPVTLSALISTIGRLVVDSKGSWILPVISGNMICRLGGVKHSVVKADWIEFNRDHTLNEVENDDATEIFLA